MHFTSHSIGLCLFILAAAISRHIDAAEQKLPVTFSAGHEIGKNDFGRPVVLIAAAWGSSPKRFARPSPVSRPPAAGARRGTKPGETRRP